AVGLAALAYCGYFWANAWISQTSANSELDRSLHSAEANYRPTRSLPPKPSLETGSLVGRIEVPRLQMSAVVFEGCDTPVLNRGRGHLHGSALPGEKVNVVLAAHRDTFFRGLKNIRQQDVVNISTPDGIKSYRVESIRIVGPKEISVMNPTPDPELTLITCY